MNCLLYSLKQWVTGFALGILFAFVAPSLFALDASDIISEPTQMLQQHANSKVARKSYQSSTVSLTKSSLLSANIPTSAVQSNVSIVPLKKSRNALLIEASLNNRSTGTFIVDTGATYTSISQEMAEELGIDLDNSDFVYVTTVNGRIKVPKVVIKKININGLVAHDVEATVINIRKGSSFSGLLGLSFLRQFKMTIDPNAEHLVFHH